MNELKTTTMAAIHDAILLAVREHWAGQENQLETVAEYDPFDKAPVNSPAILLSIENMAINERDNTGRTGIILDCTLTCILSTRTPNVQVQIRQLAAEIIRLVEQNGMSRWGLGNCCNIAGNINAQPALYSPKKSGFESFAVTWSQVFYIGGYDKPAESLPNTVFASKTPEIGIPYQADYEQLTEFDESPT